MSYLFISQNNCVSSATIRLYINKTIMYQLSNDIVIYKHCAQKLLLYQIDIKSFLLNLKQNNTLSFIPFISRMSCIEITYPNLLYKSFISKHNEAWCNLGQRTSLLGISAELAFNNSPKHMYDQ